LYGLRKKIVTLFQDFSLVFAGRHIVYKTAWKMLRTSRFSSHVVGYFQYAGVFRRPDLRGNIVGMTLNITLIQGRL
jgi:hypothetical protein